MKNQPPQTSRKASRSRGERHSTSSNTPNPGSPCPIIKLGVDTHVASYTVARMFDSGAPQPAQTMSPEAFLAFAQKQKKLGKRVVAAYEAGPLGFFLQRQLSALGIECLVVAPQNWDERHKRTKTDKIDAREIVSRLDRYLAGNRHALAVVRVPSLEEEVARDLSRERDQFKKDRTRMINRGHALLRKYGLTRLGCWWEDDALEPIRPRLLELFAGQAKPEELVKSLMSQMGDYAEQIQHLSVRLGDITEQLEEASRQRNQPRVKGVGHLSLEKLGREVCDWNRFANRRQVASYTGLCPGRDQSGGRGTELSVNKCGNPRLRETLVELAWLLLRYQPHYVRLKRWQWVFAKGSTATRAARKKAIVALARQLAVDLWRIFTARANPQDLGLTMAG
jgi:transposase